MQVLRGPAKAGHYFLKAGHYLLVLALLAATTLGAHLPALGRGRRHDDLHHPTAIGPAARDAAPALTEALRDPAGLVRESARGALARIEAPG